MFKQLLPRPNNVPKNLNYRRKKIDSDGIEVLQIRKQLSRIIERNHDVLADVTTVTLFISTDGATPFRSEKKTFWPFWALVDNLPSHRRTALENMILVALWKGKTKPDFNSIGPMIKKELVNITTAVYCSKVEKHFDVKLGDFICDMVAKASSLNVVHFNGYYGCVYCYMRGVHENHRHLYPCQASLKKFGFV